MKIKSHFNDLECFPSTHEIVKMQMLRFFQYGNAETNLQNFSGTGTGVWCTECKSLPLRGFFSERVTATGPKGRMQTSAFLPCLRHHPFQSRPNLDPAHTAFSQRLNFGVLRCSYSRVY